MNTLLSTKLVKSSSWLLTFIKRLFIMNEGDRMNTYFETTNDKQIKYAVKVDKAKLRSLRAKILKNCLAKRKCTDKKQPWDFINWLKSNPAISDISYVENGCWEDFYGDTKLYDVNYLKLDYPPLLLFIDDILEDDYTEFAKLLDLLNSPKSAYKPTSPLKPNKKSITLSLGNISTASLDKQINHLTELKEELEAHEEWSRLNSHLEPIETYYEAIKECIHLTKVDEIDLETINRVKNFQKVNGR